GLGTNRPVSGGKTGDPLDTAPGAAPNTGVKMTTNPVVVPAGDVTSGGAARAWDGHPQSPAPTVRAERIAAMAVRFISVPPLPLYHLAAKWSVAAGTRGLGPNGVYPNWISGGTSEFSNDAPPSAYIVCPVIHPASSAQRSAATPPMSPGGPSRPIGVHPRLSQLLMTSCASVGRLFVAL